MECGCSWESEKQQQQPSQTSNDPKQSTTYDNVQITENYTAVEGQKTSTGI
jgi:hypothetical protein